LLFDINDFRYISTNYGKNYYICASYVAYINEPTLHGYILKAAKNA